MLLLIYVCIKDSVKKMFGMNKKIVSNRVTRNKGFTLVEVMVVLVIMGILVAIAAPTVGGYIDRITLRDYVRTAKMAEDTVMSLSGMQYAKVGNPIIGNPDPNAGQWDLTWAKQYHIDESEKGKQYIYVDAWRYNNIVPESGPALELMRIAPANLGADPGDGTPAHPNLRTSAGITEYRSRTGEDIPIEDWIAHNGNVNECEQRISQSVFVLRDKNATNHSKWPVNFGQIAQGHYMRYDRYGSWMFRTINGKRIVVLHNFKLVGSDNPGDVIDGVTNFEATLRLVGDQWNVYEFIESSYSGDKNTEGKYTNFTSSYRFIGSVGSE